MDTSPPCYVLITAARNEAKYIENTIQSVVAQTHKPSAWIIVSDGSTDGTDDIVNRYAGQHTWIRLLRMPERTDRQFAAKARAVNAAYDLLQDADFEVVGNLDADVTFPSGYFDFLLQQFAADPKLGVAGTVYIEPGADGSFQKPTHEYTDLNHVSGPCQLFRRTCFESVGGYQPIKGGAIDWIAVTTARMKGWRTRTFPEQTFFHHRPMGTAESSVLQSRFHYGRKAYYVGGHPLWALLRGTFHMKNRPLIIGGLAYQAGFFWAMLTRMERPVSRELMAFHRKEQLSRLQRIFTRRA